LTRSGAHALILNQKFDLIKFRNIIKPWAKDREKKGKGGKGVKLDPKERGQKLGRFQFAEGLSNGPLI